MMKSNLLTAAEAAQLKGVSSEAVYAAIRDGRLPYQKVLGRLGVSETDVLAWTLTPRAGRKKGTRLSEEAKAKISESQKQRWARRNLNTAQKADADASDSEKT